MALCWRIPHGLKVYSYSCVPLAILLNFNEFLLSLKKPHSHFLAIHTTDRKAKSREQIQAMRKTNKKGEKTERIHKQNHKNKQDTYFRVIEWRTADVLQSVRSDRAQRIARASSEEQWARNKEEYSFYSPVHVVSHPC